MAAAIELRGVVKQFEQVRALKGLDASIEAGRVTGLVGPDGSGKTTLMRIMACLMSPDEGSVHVADHDVATDAQAIYSVVGYMPQRFGLYEDLSVLENLRLYADLRGLDREAVEPTFEQLLRFTRLAPFTARPAGRLSGGMKQKLGLACALMGRPKVLLLDEPSVGVDPVSRRDLWRMVQELSGEGMAVVWSTAYLDEAERCDAVLLLNAGVLEYAGRPQELAQRIAGRSFRVVGVDRDRRQMLADTLDLRTVRDGVIQGGSVRVVLSEGASRAELDSTAAARGGRLEPVAPRFEDAFIDLLGGGPGGRSAIAEKMTPIRVDAEITVSCRNLTKRFGEFVATDDGQLRRAQGRSVRPARAEWRRQVHHVQDAVRPA